MKRYYVSRHYIKWKGRLYRKGELLPPEFNHHDKARNIYSSRIGEMELEEAPKAPLADSGEKGNLPPSPESSQASSAAESKPSEHPSQDGASGAAPKFTFVSKTTGTPK